MFRFLKHFLSAKHSNGFGVHSPYIFNFIKNVIYEKNVFYVYDEIETLRIKLLQDHRKIYFNDFGTGKDRTTTVAEIAKKSIKNKKEAQLIFRIANFVQPDIILELGTSLGLTTSYLSATNSKSKCITVDGCISVLKIAEENFLNLNRYNILPFQGNIEDVLPRICQQFPKFDLVFIDANHTSEALIRYFEMLLSNITDETVIIVDDIHLTSDMEQGWKSIKNHPEVIVSMDLYCIGIVFFKKELNKNHYVLRF